MTIFRRIRGSIVMAAALFSLTARGDGQCPPTPHKYRHLEFGDVRFAVEEDCRSTFAQHEQFFLAGIAHALRNNCKLPGGREGRALVERFTKAATLSFDLRKRHGLEDRVPAQPDGTAAFAAGTSMMEEIRCNGPEAALLARGLVLYLKRTAGNSRFIEGCVELYADRYTDRECRCIADAVRTVLPDVHQRFFDREIVKESIHHSPRIALTLMLSCGVPDY